jgi:hypothetical protein
MTLLEDQAQGFGKAGLGLGMIMLGCALFFFTLEGCFADGWMHAWKVFLSSGADRYPVCLLV